MNNNILYFHDHPIVANDDIAEEDWLVIESHLDAIMVEDYISEEEARVLFEALNDDLYGGTRSVINHVLSVSSSYSKSWLFLDTRDESKNPDTAFMISEFKLAGFEEDVVSMPISPLPTYPIRRDPLKWMADAVKIGLNTLTLQKWFVYAVWEGFRLPLKELTLFELSIAELVKKTLEELEFEAPRLEELRIDALESVDKTLSFNTKVQ